MSLSGCDVLLENQAKGPIAIAEAAGELQVVVCIDAEADAIAMGERPKGEAWFEFWRVDAPVELEAGDEVFGAVSEAGLRPQGVAPGLNPGDLILVQLIGDGSTGIMPPQAGFVVPEDGMPEEGWLHPDDSVTANPCDGLNTE